MERSAVVDDDRALREIHSSLPAFVRGGGALALPYPSLAAQIGPLLPGQVVLLEGGAQLLNACAHSFLVEAVRERLETDEWQGPQTRDPRAIVVDGGNCVSPYLFASSARARAQDPELLTPRVRLARAFTAYQMVSLLTEALEAELEARPCDLLAVLCVRALFEDEDLEACEARQLARHACGTLGAIARKNGAPCLITSPSPSCEPLPIALERIAREAATRVVGDLHPASVPGFSESQGQRALDAWGSMPSRPTVAGAPAGTARGAALIGAHWRAKTLNAKVHADEIA